MSFSEKLSTYRALGISNVLRVGAYRVGLKSGFHSVLKISTDAAQAPFYFEPNTNAPTSAVPRQNWKNQAIHFGRHEFPIDGPPDWHANPFEESARSDSAKPWFKIGDFSSGVGDIKAVWEASRFDWLIAMAQRASCGDSQEITRINEWLEDWLVNNSPYLGANWKCGQEASIRVLHLAIAGYILKQTGNPLPGVLALVECHLKRIAPTISYAIGQQNNHGTSEAAALFVGGLWLAQNGHSEGEKWSRLGRKWLEDRASALIEDDGTFSQYSVNYHRVMLDTYNFAEVWRRHLGADTFSTTLMDRISAAVLWLHQLTIPESGDAPNLGANDGARILAMTDTDYRDFRPSVQLGAALFLGKRAYTGNGAYDQPLFWLDVPLPSGALNAPSSATLDQGGLHILRKSNAVAYFRYPRFRFRPSQADALHVDFWLEDQNIFRDAGTYSYNSSSEETAYFNGVEAHNTIQFDQHDQMPRLGRFLFGKWLKAHAVKRVSTNKAGFVTASAGYNDTWGNEHVRSVSLRDNLLECEDRIAGVAKSATLRWRLSPGDWQISGQEVSNGTVKIVIEGEQTTPKLSLTKVTESRYYLERTNVPAIEVTTDLPDRISTRVIF